LKVQQIYLVFLDIIETKVIEQDVKLIIVDSIAALVRKEFGTESIAARQDVLAKQASRLKFLAESFNIPVVVTNQVTTRYGKDTRTFTFNEDEIDEQLEETYITAALGVTWAHAVNTRFVLEFTPLDSKIRQLTIAKSPLAPVISIAYSLQSAGLVIEETAMFDQTQPNYWNMRIQSRTNNPTEFNVSKAQHTLLNDNAFNNQGT